MQRTISIYMMSYCPDYFGAIHRSIYDIIEQRTERSAILDALLYSPNTTVVLTTVNSYCTTENTRQTCRRE